MTHDELAAIIGPLAHRLTERQVDELEPIASSNPTGLAKVVASVEADPNIESDVGAILARCRRGDVPKPRRRSIGHHDAGDTARRLYTTKLDLLHRASPDWTEAEQRQHAIDYALDHCRATGEALWRIERELKAEHQTTTLDGQERDFERDTEHRRLMVEHHHRDSATLDDRARIAAEPDPDEPDPAPAMIAKARAQEAP